MSMIICAYDQNTTALCSEDRAGTTDVETGAFTHVSSGHLKSIRVNQNSVFAVLGSVALAAKMRDTMQGLSHLTFAELALVIPKLARTFLHLAGNGFALQCILTGFDGERIRTIVWNHDDDFAVTEEQPPQTGEVLYSVLGTSKGAHQRTYELLMTQPPVPDFVEVFEILSAEFPAIGTGLTTHSVQRPTGGEPTAPLAVADNSVASIPYHGSAFRRVQVSSHSGTSNAAIDDSDFVTVTSLVLQIPSGFSQYRATMTVSKVSGTGISWFIEGRLKVGSIVSNTVDLSSSNTTTSATVTLTGLTGGTQITILSQCKITATDGIPGHSVTAQVSWQQNEYFDQDISNLQ